MKTNTIYNESCISTMAKMPSEFIDLVVTSPPYYNAKDYISYNSVEEYMEQMIEIFSEVYDKMKESRMCVINISPVLVKRISRSKQSYRIPLPFYFVPALEKIGFEFLEDIIWEKPSGSVPNRGGGFYRHRKPVAYKPNIVTEYILVLKKPSSFLIDKVLRKDSLVLGDYEKTNIWKVNPETASKHPAPFPKKLVEKIIKYYSYEGDLVYDPFIGSGTVAVVAIKTGRSFIGSEIKKEYADMANERIGTI